LSDFGYLLNNTWQLKRALEKEVTNSSIDAVYTAAIKAGALGGKLVGAGGGGFMLLFVPPEKKGAVRRALSDYHEVTIGINAPGSAIIYS
jgi:D-glycero-alpha-D-manno-heptose-7-phosphate kinase